MSNRHLRCAPQTSFFFGVTLLGAALSCALASPTRAQIPDEFTNLQFFPEGIARDELIGHMRQFSFALGVRCQYCHFGGDGISFDGVEFDSDEKPEKRRARAMLEMTDEINGTLLSAIPERRSPHVVVECRTCHRGLSRPRMIDELLRQKIADEDVTAAIAWYENLREEEYGGWSYDFGEWVINDLASTYGDAGEPATGAALLRMNGENFPESLSIWVSLGDLELAADNRDAAIEAYRRGLSLAPDNPGIVRRLEALDVDPRTTP